MAVATVLGVAGGVYIYKPVFQPSIQNVTDRNCAVNQDDTTAVQSEEKPDQSVTRPKE